MSADQQNNPPPSPAPGRPATTAARGVTPSRAASPASPNRLTPAELEDLRGEMQRDSEWARQQLASRR